MQARGKAQAPGPGSERAMDAADDAPETRPALPSRPDGGLHVVSMSSLLSSDTSTPRAAAAAGENDDESRHVVQLAVPPPRAGLSSLMNSPMPDEDEEMAEAPSFHTSASPRGAVVRITHSVEASEPTSTQDDVEMEEANAVSGEERRASTSQPAADHHTIGELRDAELEALKPEFHAAIHKFLKSDIGVPTAKRQKKSKQQRKSRANTSGEAAMLEVQRCVRQLRHKVSSQFPSTDVLSDVVQFCLAFCSILDEKVPVSSFVETVKSSGERDNAVIAVDMATTLERLQQKPVYSQLVDVVRCAVLSSSESTASELLKQVLEWCFSRVEPAHWTWILASVAQMNSYCLQDFLLREAIARFDVSDPKCVAVTHLLPVLEFLITQNSSQIVDILRDLLEECSTGSSGSTVCGVAVNSAVQRLVALASESAVLVKACDESLQWVVTEELVVALASKLASQDDTEVQVNGNGRAKTETPAVDMEAQLLQFLGKRSAELPNSGFQLLQLLQNLSTTTESRPRPTEAAVASFQRHLLEFAASEPSRAFVQGVYRFLPFICQSSLRLLGLIVQGEANTEMETDASDKEGLIRRFQQWKHWLRLLAQSISRKEVTERLIEAELMLAEFDELPLTLPLTAIQPADRALCDLLGSILAPTSQEYVTFVRNTVQACPTSTPRARRRLLGIVQTLLSLNTEGDAETGALPVKLHPPSTDQGASSCLQQLCSVPSWRYTQDAFALWKGSRGVDFWESFVDLACSRDPVVASRALALVARTPFLSLEDPAWQYRCVRKLSVVFFSLLRQYRSDLVYHGETENEKSSRELGVPSDSDLQSRLQTLKLVLFRVLALDGGVAHYPSSVYSVFASLWMDALLSTTSATSIPTHFPDGVNFGKHADDTENGTSLEDGRTVIRCERTISSKCTNLQSSQVITKVPEALVYRKTLDSSWAREMDAARICSVYATELFSQLVVSTGTASSLLEKQSQVGTDEDEQCERRLKTVVDLLLERVIPCCGIPSDETYKDTLPNRSSFDVDLRVEQWLNHFPAFLPLLRVVIATSNALGSSQLLRLVPVLKSALIVLLGHWNSVKGELSLENVDVPPYMRNRNQLALSCELMRLLRATGWLPTSLAKTAELLPLTTPADIRAILFSCWFYLSDHPPRTDSRAPTPATSATTSPISSGSSPAGFSISGLATSGPSASTSNPPLEFYLIPLRKALHRNIHKIGAKYALFMC